MIEKCTECGSDKMMNDEIIIETDFIGIRVVCLDCDTKWTDFYNYSNSMDSNGKEI
jgi:predicted nucleic-acid-binding Zn-ribbon protein